MKTEYNNFLSKNKKWRGKRITIAAYTTRQKIDCPNFSYPKIKLQKRKQEVQKKPAAKKAID